MQCQVLIILQYCNFIISVFMLYCSWKHKGGPCYDEIPISCIY